MKSKLLKNAKVYLNKLCVEISDRSVGSEGNRKATQLANEVFSRLGWNCEMAELKVMDWQEQGAELVCRNRNFEVFVGPYSLGCDVKGKLVGVSKLEDLEKIHGNGDILLLHGELVREQLMPKNFVFYNPEEHKHIVYLLENSKAKAFISATGHNGATAGGIYPFPLIEDGDFNIPNVYMTDKEGEKLLACAGNEIHLKSHSKRISTTAYNNIARLGSGEKKIVITAHIDAKKNIPGAIDNATGVVVLFLLAELLNNYRGKYQIELVAFNGEDYFAVPGQMDYIASKKGDFSDVLLNINIDGAGYFGGKSAFSFFDLPQEFHEEACQVLEKFEDITEGIQWVQGDHSIFVQFGRPAIAISSEWFINNFESQTITHTDKDNLSIVNPEKLVDIALAVETFVKNLN